MNSVDNFSKVRSFFPHTGNCVYLNSAAYGPFCTPVADAVRENIDLRLVADRDDTAYVTGVAARLREDFAWLIGARSADIGIGMNTSFGLNIAAYGLPLATGDEVIVTDIEFPALIYTWQAAAKHRGLKLVFAHGDMGHVTLEQLASLVTSRTRVIAISFVQFHNGHKYDLAAIGELCRKHDIFFVVDGIQGCGVEPIDVQTLGIDVFTSGCQKWLLSPQGCGFFYLPERIRERISQPFMSWLGVDWQLDFTDLFRYDLHPFESARRFEMGYHVVFNLLGMKAAIDLFRSLGVREIQQHNYALIDRLARYVVSRDDMRVTSSLEPGHRSSIFTFTCDAHTELHKQLLEERIIQVCREGSIRLSIHLFNDDSDIDRMIGALEQLRPRTRASSLLTKS